jgi:hypothetical protein
MAPTNTPTDGQILETGGKTSPQYVRNEKGEIVSSKSIEEELKKKYSINVKPGVIRAAAFQGSAAYTAAFNAARDAGATVHDAHIAAEKAKANAIAAYNMKK